jgi:proliferating cell nuclear antigen
MEIIINDSTKSDSFTTIFQYLKNFTECINIEFNEDGIHFQTMDNSHVSVVKLNIPKKWFSQYSCSKNIVLGINISILHKILATKEKNQLLQVIYLEESDVLEIHFLNQMKEKIEEKKEEKPKKSRKKKTDETEKEKEKEMVKTSEIKCYDKHFQIPLVDMDIEQMAIPEIDYEVEFSLFSSNFSNIVNQLKMFGDTMEIKCSEEKITLYSNSSDLGKMSVIINVDDLTEFSINEGYLLKQCFSLTYLNHICAFHRLAKEINIKISAEYPLYTFYDLGEEAHITFHLAPKINDE